MVDALRAFTTRLQIVGRISLMICLTFAGLLSGCRSQTDTTSVEVIQPSELVPFEELFAFEDSLVLDPSVILGQIWFMDVDDVGSLLITDIASDLVHLFAHTGEHQTTYSMDTCLPTDDGLSVWWAQFASDNRVILATFGRAMVVFDRSGECLAAKQLPAQLKSFCTIGDSIFTFRGLQGVSTSIIDVYSMDLELHREILLPPPTFPQLNRNYGGISGRDFACFDSGPWYKYPEEMDASPIYAHGLVARAQPEFFVKRDRDVRKGLSLLEEVQESSAFPSLDGLYALDSDTRMGVFSRIGDEYRSDNMVGTIPFGLSIVSNNGKFSAKSTVPYRTPKATHRGYLYILGDHVSADDGDVGNRIVIRYRFKVPNDG